jgi:hypothetical protein
MPMIRRWRPAASWRARAWCGAALGRAASPPAAHAAELRAPVGEPRVRRAPIQALSKTARPLREARWTWGDAMPPGYPDCAAKISRPRFRATASLSHRRTVVAVEARFGRRPHTSTLSRGTAGPVSICRLRGLLRLGDRGQRLIVCPLLEAALELFRRRRGCPPWMPHDPYDPAHGPTPTASCRRPIRGGRALAVSAAALTDHVRDRWHWTARLPEVGFPFGGSARRLRIGKPRNLRRSRSRSVARGEGRQ